MSALTVAGLFHLENLVRVEAERIRMRNLAVDASAVATEHARAQRTRADEFDQIGNLLAGLQADWDELGPKVRAGFIRLRREYEAIKDLALVEGEDAA